MGLLKKNIFKVITFKDILNNVQIFNFRFWDKVKNAKIDKAYEKN